ncbi:MAG: 4-alpha-glucanotransferase [Bacteroidales bacterium]|jgi:4-alpha-glucanotransferase|nr:4-alpha-glucanotransferase [Bacteroidales bacterium]
MSNKNKRQSGILLHISSLPGNYGIGTLGKEALKFVDFLKTADVKIWQTLPLGHSGYGNSPYQCYSAYAGNPLLIDLDWLKNKELLLEVETDKIASKFENSNKVDFNFVENYKYRILKTAFQRFKSKENFEVAYDDFCNKNKHWLDDYSLFISFKKAFKNTPLSQWQNEVKYRNREILDYYKAKLEDEINFNKFLQYIFFEQWFELKNYANKNGIEIMGDIPIYVSADSADLWSNPHFFQTNDDLSLSKLAGVPPDYFSEDGQLWGNPLYDWKKMENDNFQWWIKRIEFNCQLFDIVRIDHFRAFSEFWSVDASEKTAKNGEWISAPGYKLFEAIKNNLGELKIVAEDLGIITQDVEDLRDHFNFPGMKVLQFAFDGSKPNTHLPHYHNHNSVVYTGTHDNDTTKSWFETNDENTKNIFLEYTNSKFNEAVWSMIRLAWSSVAQTAIAPIQDFLELDGEERMNTPGTTENNWIFRCKPEQIDEQLAQKIKILNKIYDR